MPKFKREERYIVVKLARLQGDDEQDLRDYLTSYQIPTEQCVVVEHDWPIYEQVWDMVQRMDEGRPQKVDEIEAMLQDAQWAMSQAEEREAALAAHVETLEKSVSEFAAYAGVPGVLRDDTKRAYEVLNSKPTTSLARRDLTKKAEALTKLINQWTTESGREADPFNQDWDAALKRAIGHRDNYLRLAQPAKTKGARTMAPRTHIRKISMTDFTVKVCADRGDEGTNKIEVFIDTEPKQEIMVLTTDGNSLDDMDEEVEPQDVALYYAVERIAQLESIVESQKASVLREAYEKAKKRIAQMGDSASNLTMQVAHRRWKEADAENRKLRMYYAGAAGLLAQLSDLAYEAGEGRFDLVERAIKDWCEFSGWTYEIHFDTISLIGPEGEEI